MFHVLPYEPLELKADATYVEEPVEILDTKEQVLRTRAIHWVKVSRENHRPEEATWELRDQVQRKYLHLLPEVCGCHLKDQMSAGGGDPAPFEEEELQFVAELTVDDVM